MSRGDPSLSARPVRQFALPEAALCLLFCVVWAATRPRYVGDTFWYASDIQSALAGKPGIFWEFAHLCWRPLGALLSSLLQPLTEPLFPENSRTAIVSVLTAAGAAASLCCALLICAGVRRISQSAASAFLAGAAWLGLSAVINYQHSGAAYLPGLALTTIALYLNLFSPGPARKTAILSGLCLAAAVLLWMPFFASWPVIAFAGWVFNWNGRRTDRRAELRWVVWMTLVAGGVTVGAYVAVVLGQGITTMSGLTEWIRWSAHGVSQDRRFLKLATGVARVALDLGNDAVWLKWYVNKDPYAGVTLMDIVREIAGKLALFYAALLFLLALTVRTITGMRLAAISALAFLPHAIIALSYESAPPERYLAGVPPLLLAFGSRMSSGQPWVRTVTVLLCLLPAAFNWVGLSASSVNARNERNAARIAPLASLPPHSRLLVVNNFDDLFSFRYTALFHPLNRMDLPEVQVVDDRTPAWRPHYACAVLSSWEKGGEVWLSRRFLAAQPQRDWFWVDADLPDRNWADYRALFPPLDLGPPAGGADGFVRIEPTEQNRTRIGSLKTSCPSPEN